MAAYTPTPRTTIHRIPARGTYDRATVHAILDAAPIAHVGFAVDGMPFVIPTIFVREGEVLFVHGAVASRMLKALASGVPTCVTATLLDGLVMARSAFHHSMNYRSVMAFGTAREIVDRAEKERVLALIVEKMGPGRSRTARAPNEKELHATSVLRMPIDEVSAKVRMGGPIDEPEDMDVPVWAGVVPLAMHPAAPCVHAPCLDATPPELPAWLGGGGTTRR